MPPSIVAPFEPDSSIDYTPLAFFPERWRSRKIGATMHVYRGSHVVFLCLVSRGPYDPAVMSYLVSRLDAGWKGALRVVACPSPAPRTPAHVVAGSAALVAAVPDPALTCGYGCGYTGCAGVEVAGFYDRDYPALLEEARGGSPLRSFPHYYYYEFGRNFCVFGPKHSSFGTGFAVLLRYFLMDLVGATDPDAPVRERIEQCEELYAEAATSCGRRHDFVGTMTRTSNSAEKADRIPGHVPSDQPCMYASAQLRLLRKSGTEEWLRKFFAALRTVPHIEEDSATPEVQCDIWFVCASAAAGRLLEEEFVKRWRFHVAAGRLDSLRTIDWRGKPDSSVKEAIARGFLQCS